MQATWTSYRASRRAVIHTVEISPSYSAHAEKLVRGFHRGIYAPHVDFYVSNVSDWISDQLESRRKPTLFQSPSGPFLNYVVLDMPGSHLQIEKVASVMREGGLLVIFVPSVTQIGDCVKIIQDKQIPLRMEKVLELGESISNGRTWDVRLAKRRARATTPTVTVEDGDKDKTTKDMDPEASPTVQAIEDGDIQETPAETRNADDAVMVCRPKVGRMTIGGGFIGLWRKVDSSHRTERLRDEQARR